MKAFPKLLPKYHIFGFLRYISVCLVLCPMGPSMYYSTENIFYWNLPGRIVAVVAICECNCKCPVRTVTAYAFD